VRRLTVLVRGFALVLVAAAPGCDTLPSGPPHAPADRIRGFNLADWSPEGYAFSPHAEPVCELADVGANELSIVVTAYQSGPFESSIRAHDPRTPLPWAVRVPIATAAEVGLSVTLKPHVDLDDGSWRGHIDPADPDAWFADYEAFVLEWARFGETYEVGGFVIGTELAGTLRHEAHWRRLIERVRAEFSGKLTYAASWDEAHLVTFWSALDLVGIDFYFPVAGRPNPGRLEILAGWQPWLARLERLHRQTGKPVVITEIGYRSVRGAAQHPYAFGDDATLDLFEQADLYWAAIEATGREDWIAGIYFWNWLAAGGGGEEDTDFTPRWKPAEDVLRGAWGP
jgi:hypothetical protein